MRCFFLHTLEGINAAYPALFGKRISEERSEQDGSGADTERFIEIFGWIHNAKMVAEHEGIPLEQVWNLGVIQFLNDLLYLKMKDKYDAEQLRKISNKR